MNNSKELQLVKFPSHPSPKPTQPGAELEQLLAMLDIGKNQFIKWKQLVRVMRQLGKDLTFDEISALAQHHAQNYERFLVSNAPIRALEVRVGEMKFWTTILNRPDGIKESTFERMLPENALLQVWRQADEEFDDIPLLFQDLAEVSREGLSRTQQYGNDRSLRLEVSKNEIGEYKIKLSFVVGHETDEDAELLDMSNTEESPKVVAIPASQVQGVLPNVHRSIPAYLYSAAVAVLIFGLILAVNGGYPFQHVDDTVTKSASTSPSGEKEKTEEQHWVLLKTERDSRKVEDTSTRKQSGNVSPDGTSTSLISATGNDYNREGNPTVGTPTAIALELQSEGIELVDSTCFLQDSLPIADLELRNRQFGNWQGATVVFTVTLPSLNKNPEASIFNSILIRPRGFEDDESDKYMVVMTGPESTSMFLLGAGLIGAAAGLRRRRRP